MLRYTYDYKFEEESIPIVGLIEDLVNRGKAFQFSHLSESKMNIEDLRFNLRNNILIGCGGEETYPFISDWSGRRWGAFLIDVSGGKLVYGADAFPLHKMRDAYTWRIAADRFLTTLSMRGVISEFLSHGYQLMKDSGSKDGLNGTFCDYKKSIVDPHAKDFCPMSDAELEEILNF